MLSKPPAALAALISRSHTSATVGSSTAAPAISLAETSPESPSVHTITASPAPEPLVGDVHPHERLGAERLEDDVPPLAALGLLGGELAVVDQLLDQRLVLRELAGLPSRTRYARLSPTCAT
jgi:hypothetical protein